MRCTSSSHLDDPSAARHDNQAVDQIVAADRIIVNKIDLVRRGGGRGDRSAGARPERDRARSSGRATRRSRSTASSASAHSISRTPWRSSPDFLDDHHHAHEHDAAVESIAAVYDARFDRVRLATFIERLLDARGDDIFRVKGIVAVADDHRRCVLQAVHRIMELRPANPWGAETPTSKIVFIGRKLDRAAIEAGLRDSCLAL